MKADEKMADAGIETIEVKGSTSLQAGDVVQIILTHACVVANMMDYLIGCRNGVVARKFCVDACGSID